MACRCCCEGDGSEEVVGDEGKNAGERREAKVCLKSGGVTSETNQGMIFGLSERKVVSSEANREGTRKRNVLENDARNVRRVCYEKVGENEVCEKLQGSSAYLINANDERLTSKPAVESKVRRELLHNEKSVSAYHYPAQSRLGNPARGS